MALTKATDLTNSAVTRYEKAYLDTSLEYKEMWGQFVDWEPPIADDGGFGGTIDWPFLGSLDPVEDALTEDADVTPQALSDYNMTLSPAEYGKAVGKTQLASFKSRVPLAGAFGRKVALNRVESVDRIIRRAVCGRGSSYPTMTMHVDASAAMSSLTSTDTITWAWLTQLRMQAKYMGIEPIDGAGNYGSVIHPLLEYDLMQLNEFKYPGYYKTGDDSIMQGEIGMLAGIRFIVSPQGRLYMGAGTSYAASAPTTLNGAVNKGATSITTTSNSNLGAAVGEYITIGTVETESTNPGNNLEQVLVTAVNSETITVRGNGDANNFGLRFDHATGEALNTAYNVCAVPILGRGSLKGVYGSRTGRYGQAITTQGLDLLKRFVYFGWYWYGGVARVEKLMILGKCATAQNMIGYN